MTVGEAILSPTRTFAPVVKTLLETYAPMISGLIHCSGGAQTKCLKFGRNLHYVKDNLFPVPAIFDAIQAASQSSDEEMYQVFNMGHRLEVYAPDKIARDVIDIAASYGIAAQVIGYTESNPHNKLSLRSPAGRTIVYG